MMMAMSFTVGAWLAVIAMYATGDLHAATVGWAAGVTFGSFGIVIMGR